MIWTQTQQARLDSGKVLTPCRAFDDLDALRAELNGAEIQVLTPCRAFDDLDRGEA